MRKHRCSTGAGTMQANASICKHRCRGMQACVSIDAARVQERCKHMQACVSIDAGECKHMQASMQASMQHGCRNDAARVQERCSTGAARVQERCRSDAEGANAGSASMLCVHSIALHAGESGIDGAGKRNMLAVCLHCLHFSAGVKKRAAHPTRATARQRITARRGGKRGVRGEMRGIVRRVPTCGAFRRAARFDVVGCARFDRC